MGKKKKEIGIGFDCIIDGNSKEAEEIYRKLGWFEVKSPIDEANKEKSTSMNKVLYYLLVLLLAWLSHIFFDETLWLFGEKFFTWHEFLKDKG